MDLQTFKLLSFSIWLNAMIMPLCPGHSRIGPRVLKKRRASATAATSDRSHFPYSVILMPVSRYLLTTPSSIRVTQVRSLASEMIILTVYCSRSRVEIPTLCVNLQMSSKLTSNSRIPQGDQRFMRWLSAEMIWCCTCLRKWACPSTSKTIRIKLLCTLRFKTNASLRFNF